MSLLGNFLMTCDIDFCLKYFDVEFVFGVRFIERTCANFSDKYMKALVKHHDFSICVCNDTFFINVFDLSDFYNNIPYKCILQFMCLYEDGKRKLEIMKPINENLQLVYLENSRREAYFIVPYRTYDKVFNRFFVNNDEVPVMVIVNGNRQLCGGWLYSIGKQRYVNNLEFAVPAIRILDDDEDDWDGEYRCAEQVDDDVDYDYIVDNVDHPWDDRYVDDGWYDIDDYVEEADGWYEVDVDDELREVDIDDDNAEFDYTFVEDDEPSRR